MNRPILGVGLKYVQGVEALLQPGAGLVDVLEIEPQTIWFRERTGSYRINEFAFESVRSCTCAKLLHGVGFPVGGSRPPDPAQIPLLLDMSRALDAHWISEHLGFNTADGELGAFKTGFLLPPRQSIAGVNAAVASIRSMASELPLPFAVETGVSYLKPRADELSESDFVTRVIEGADCGLLLDLHNLWTNEKNGRETVRSFLDRIPLDRVWEMHLAGGEEHQGYWLDAHCGSIPEAVLEIARELIPRLPNLSAMIFEISLPYLPQFGVESIGEELEKMRELWLLRPNTESGKFDPRRDRCTPLELPVDIPPSPEEWEDALGALVAGRPVDGELAAQLAADPGVNVTKDLVHEFRASSLVSALKLTCRLLMLTLGKSKFEELVSDFCRRVPPQLFSTVEAECFANFLDSQQLVVPHLSAVINFERGAMRAMVERISSIVHFEVPPWQLLGALGEGRLPEAQNSGSYEVEVTPPSHFLHDQTTQGRSQK